MPEAPEWLRDLLGWTPATTAKTRAKCISVFGAPIGPNISDRSNGPSMRIAGHIYDAINIPRTKEAEDLGDDNDDDEEEEEKKPDPGTLLEEALKLDLGVALRGKDRDRKWIVDRHLLVTEFSQFQHLSEIQRVFDENPMLRSTFGGDYQILTDVCVGVENSADASALPFLHAALSSKWSIRSDRVQNVRHEFATLVRNRRGRAPHLVAVTAEPLPSRLLSIARGTGEVDQVYHLLYEQLDEAVKELWGQLRKPQREAWTEMTEQKRLRPYTSLVDDLILS